MQVNDTRCSDKWSVICVRQRRVLKTKSILKVVFRPEMYKKKLVSRACPKVDTHGPEWASQHNSEWVPGGIPCQVAFLSILEADEDQPAARSNCKALGAKTFYCAYWKSTHLDMDIELAARTRRIQKIHTASTNDTFFESKNFQKVWRTADNKSANT